MTPITDYINAYKTYVNNTGYTITIENNNAIYKLAHDAFLNIKQHNNISDIIDVNNISESNKNAHQLSSP